MPEEFTSVADAHEYITAAAELTHLQNAGAIEPVAYDNTKLLLLEMGLLTEEIDDKKNYPDVTDRGFEHGELAKLSAVNVFLIQAACDGLGDQNPESLMRIGTIPARRRPPLGTTRTMRKTPTEQQPTINRSLAE